jgi:hypothetical protein
MSKEFLREKSRILSKGALELMLAESLVEILVISDPLIFRLLNESIVLSSFTSVFC